MSKLKQGLLDSQEEFIQAMGGWGQCHDCKHYIRDDICEAFPDGIPLEIAGDEFKHIKIFPGQTNDILFKKK